MRRGMFTLRRDGTSMPQDKLKEYVIPAYRGARSFPDRTQVEFMHARKAFYDYVDQEEPDSLLDVGCGEAPDALTIELMGVNYVGVDAIEENLGKPRKKYPWLTFKQAYAQELPFEDNSFDWVYMSGVWENMPDERQMKLCIDEAIRVASSKVIALEATRKPRLMQERYMMVPMDMGLTIKRVNYDPRPEKRKANYMWIIDVEGIQ